MRYWSIAVLLCCGSWLLVGQAVVLNVAVTDKNLSPVTTLDCGEFRVYEDNVEHKLQDCRREDLPVSVGMLVDNSGSMRDKRVIAISAALAFVKASNPQSEFFLVNYSNEAYMDTNFTSNLEAVKQALAKTDSRGGTAFYDTLVNSLDHMKKQASRTKRVIVVVGDGEDNSSHSTLEQAVATSRASDAAIYAIGLLNEQRKGDRRARQVLDNLAELTGGATVLPAGAEEAQRMAALIAGVIRGQYMLSYVPTNTAADGKFRKIRVVVESKGRDKLTVRTRTGYYR